MSMSDDEREVDVESDLDDESSERGGPDKRAHHNALERKRRDHIKESFSGLRDAIPTMAGTGDKSSRAQILKKASDYISLMRKKTVGHQKDIDDLRRQNSHLEAQIKALERANQTGVATSAAEVLESSGLGGDASAGEGGREEDGYDGSGSVSDSSETSGVITIPSSTSIRTIQPGQSLLIAGSNGSNGTITLAEPARKKFKS